MNISSRKNEAVRRYRLLRKERAEREKSREFTAEGIRLCVEALECGIEITSSFMTENAARRFPEAAEKLAAVSSPDIITDDLAEYISDTGTPQGMFITARIPDNPVAFGGGGRKRIVLLDGLQDTGNVGTIIRTCDAFGINGAVLSENCADAYSPKTVRSAMGSQFRLPLMTAPLPKAMAELKENGYRIYAAMLDESAARLGSFTFPEKAAVIIGNEGNGISGEAAALADEKLYIPIKNAESLNAAVAASIICWEMTKTI